MSAITARSFHFGIGKYLEVKMKKVNYKYYAKIVVGINSWAVFFLEKKTAPGKKKNGERFGVKMNF